ncbi:MAG: hypothetical protein IPL10_19755 [Bacteroidetes bacterium]|nr:hypothetical protein [Bacteroidota bacterium]
MKIKIVLTVLLIAGCFWAGIHYAEKRQKDKHELYDLKEKYKNNYDSIYLSDLQVYYEDRPIQLTDSYSNLMKVFGACTDSSIYRLSFSMINHMPLTLDKIDSNSYSLSSIYLYDNTGFRINLAKENITIEAYQKYDDYANKYLKSYIHSKQPPKSRRLETHMRSFVICNKDTLSNIEAISLMFSHGQVMQLTILNKGRLSLVPDL